MIHTKLHKVFDAWDKHVPRDERAAARLAELRPMFKNRPHYVLEDNLLNVIKPVDVERTIDALMDADVLAPPYPVCTVEMTSRLSNGTKGTAFVALAYVETHKMWAFDLVFLEESGQARANEKTGLVKFERTEPMDKGGLGYAVRHHLMFETHVDGVNHVVAIALGMLITLTHTRGVAKEVVNTDTLRKLNKARAAHKKAEVPAYTVFKIGHTYNAAGERTAWHPGTKMRPHMRAGHVRQQVCGSGRKDRKLIFVEPVLVNCERSEDIVHVPKLVRA